MNKGINWKEELQTLRKLGLEGKTLQEIGDRYSVSRERIRQIFKKHQLFYNRSEYGQGVITAKKQEQEMKKSVDKWGLQGKLETDIYKEQRRKFIAKKANAKNCGIEFTLNFGDLEWPETCPILGIPIDYLSEGRTEFSCSFDRIDTNQGYVKGNVFIISWRANRIKNNGTAQEHVLIAEWMKDKNNCIGG